MATINPLNLDHARIEASIATDTYASRADVLVDGLVNWMCVSGTKIEDGR